MFLILGLVAGCSNDSATGPTGPRPIDAAQAEHLAVARFSTYKAGVVTVDAQIVSSTSTIQISGWADMVKHNGYGLVSATGVRPFLTFWTMTKVSAQDTQAVRAPLPVPRSGWDTLPLNKDASILAAAQLLILGLSTDRPENPQLLLQSGAKWLRQDAIGDTPVDVITGPIPDGSTESSYQYWIDKDGTLRRVEARLDGRDWSRFTLTPAAGVRLDSPS